MNNDAHDVNEMRHEISFGEVWLMRKSKFLGTYNLCIKISLAMTMLDILDFLTDLGTKNKGNFKWDKFVNQNAIIHSWIYKKYMYKINILQILNLWFLYTKTKNIDWQ